jgi:hypothetical protein
MIVPRPPFTQVQIIAPVIVSGIYIAAMSALPTEVRRKLSALIIAGAGCVYYGAGFGWWEVVFCLPMLWLAYRGLDDFRFVGVGWLLHIVWDVLHHLYGNPILPFVPLSSAGCAICDLGLAAWYLAGGPTPRSVQRLAA